MWYNLYMWDMDICKQNMFTKSTSRLSALLASTMMRAYSRNKPIIVKRTEKFPVSPRFAKPARTASKSIGLGATNKSVPNEVKWLHRQHSWVMEEFVWGWNEERNKLLVDNLKLSTLFTKYILANVIWRYLTHSLLLMSYLEHIYI